MRANATFQPEELEAFAKLNVEPKDSLCFLIRADVETMHVIRLAVEKRIQTAAGAKDFETVARLSTVRQNIIDAISEYDAAKG